MIQLLHQILGDSEFNNYEPDWRSLARLPRANWLTVQGDVHG